MKKYLYLLFALLAVTLTACSDDNDLPHVDFDISISNGKFVDGSIYVVQGQNLIIDGITVKNTEENKAAIITAASYYWNGHFLGTAIQPPYGFEIEITDKTPTGKYSLQIISPLYAVDKDIATAVLAYNVNVVASPDDLPADGSVSFTDTPAISSNSD